MLFFKQIHLTTWSSIQALARQQLAEWNESREQIFRMPKHGEVFDEVNAELNSLGLPSISIWSIFARGKRNIQDIHVDAATPTERVHSAIIVPVLGTEGSVFQWFEEPHAVINFPTNDEKSTFFKTIYRQQPKPICEVEILSPHIVRVDAPHRAIASSHSPRAIVSIKLATNPELL